MNFTEYTNTWAKSEVTQGRIMIGIGILLVVVFYFIFRSQNELLKGTLIPLGLLILLLIGYGGVIMNSRPAHAKESISIYEKSKAEAVEKEKTKHINDNKSGKMLLKYVYPILILLSVIGLFFIPSQHYKGMALGFILLFVSTYIMDNGFVSRSEAFLIFLNNIQ